MIPGGSSPMLMTAGGILIPDDYIAFYTMDNVSGSTLIDESANGYDGTISGATQTSDYLEFDGVNDYVGGISKFLSGLTAFTISINVWFDETPSASGDDFDLITIGRHASGSPLTLWWDDGGADYLTFIVSDSSANTTGVVTTSLTPATGQMENIIMTFDANNEIRIYLNNVEDSGGAIDASAINNIRTIVADLSNDFMAFGYSNLVSAPSNSKYLDGRAKNWRFYDYVVSDAQRAALATGN